MKSFLSILFFLLAVLFTMAQSPKIDSVRVTISLATSDEEKVERTFSLIEYLRESATDSTLTLAEENLDLAETVNNPEILAKTWNQIGLIQLDLYNYKKAIKSFHEALNIAEQEALSDLNTELLHNLADSYELDGEERKAIVIRMQFLDMFKEQGDDYSLTKEYFDLGINYKQLGIPDSAKMYLKISRELAELHGFSKLLLSIINSQGNIISDEGRSSEALSYYQSALKYAEKINHQRALTALYTNIAILHKDLQDYEKAEDYYLRSLKVDEQNDFDRIHIVQYNLGVLYDEMGKFEDALFYLRKALSKRDQMGLVSRQLVAALMLAEVYNKVSNQDSTNYFITYGENLMKEVNIPRDKAFALEQLAQINLSRDQIGLAETRFLEANRIYNEIGNLENISYISESLYELYKRKEDYRKALFFLERHFETKDGLLNEKQIRELARLEESYEHEKVLLKKQAEIQLIETEGRLRQFIFLGVGSLILVISFFVARSRVRAKEIKAQRLKELSKFKESMIGMIAHDLKNPLSVIMNSDNEKQSNKQMANQMLQLVNNMLDVHRFESTQVKLNVSQCSIHEIINEARAHVESLLNEKNLILKIEMHDDYIVSVDKGLIVRVFVNLLTNAIKYSPSNAKIEVALRTKGNTLQASISDEGRGIAGEKKDLIFKSFGQIDPKDSGGIGSTGLGLSFVKLALQAHHSKIELASEVGKGSTFSFDLKIDGLQKKSSTDNSTFQFEISGKAKKIIEEKLSVLRSFDLYQVGDIEKALSDIKGRDHASDHWIEEVLNSVYAGNQEKYEQLLEEFA